MTKENFTIQMEKKLKEKIRKAAEERGLSVFEATRQAIELWADSETGFWKMIHGLSERLDIAPHEVVMKLIISNVVFQESRRRGLWETGFRHLSRDVGRGAVGRSRVRQLHDGGVPLPSRTLRHSGCRHLLEITK